MLITASTGYLLYQAFWLTGCWLGGYPVRSVSADIRAAWVSSLRRAPTSWRGSNLSDYIVMQP